MLFGRPLFWMENELMMRLLCALLLLLLPWLVMAAVFEGFVVRQWGTWEIPLMQSLHRTLGDVLHYPALLLHWLGKWYVAAPLLAAFAAVQYRRLGARFALFALSAGLLPTLTMTAAKAVFERPRPELWPWPVLESGSSLPSGHSGFAAAVCVIMLVRYRSSPHFAAIACLSLAAAVLAGLSRVILGVHYPSDVLAGWINGAATVAALAWLMRPLHRSVQVDAS